MIMRMVAMAMIVMAAKGSVTPSATVYPSQVAGLVVGTVT